ncbi:MAG: hypothetical protein HY719_15555 [Planctomycetes bacterium]|nr:hypothetical protein [Planctomycetota bacterium]
MAHSDNDPGSWPFLSVAACAVALALLVAVGSDTSWAVDTTPLKINFQGRLTDASGNPATGTKDMLFKYFSVATGGTALYEESRTASNNNAVTVTQGNYAVELGGGTRYAGSEPDFKTLFKNNAAVWLEVQVVGDAAMTPRIRVLAAGFAINADLLDGYDSSDLVKKAGDSMTGALTVAGTMRSTSGGVQFPDNSVQQFSGKVINMIYREDATRVVLSAAASIQMESFTVDKKSSTSNLVIQGTICGFGDYSGSMNGGWKYGSGTEIVAQNLMYSASSSLHGRVYPTTVVIAGHTTTGPQTLVFRYFSQDASGGNKPFMVYNPNSSDDARLGQTRSIYVIWEVEP